MAKLYIILAMIVQRGSNELHNLGGILIKHSDKIYPYGFIKTTREATI